MTRTWGISAQVGQVYIVTDPSRNNWGSSAFNAQVKPNDLLLCTRHSGDYFYDYALLKRRSFGLVIVLPEGICGYGLGQLTVEKITSREYHLLMAGESVLIDEDRMSRFVPEPRK